MASEASPDLLNPQICSLDKILPHPVEWLWQPYLPSAMLTLLSGEPGAGKTYLALAIAAALTTGRQPGTAPDSAPVAAPVDVLYLGTENHPERVLRPRFDLLGGDVRRFHLLQGFHKDEGPAAGWGRVSLSDSDAIWQSIRTTHAQLMIVDTLQSYLGPGTESVPTSEMRPFMDYMSRLAGLTACAMLLIRHLNKSRTGRAAARGLGSLDLAGTVRSELLVGGAGDDSEPDCGLLHVKSNVGRLGPALGYQIDLDGAFAWTGPTELTPYDLLANPASAAGPPRGMAAAEVFLRDLFLNHRYILASQALDEAKAVGIPPRTLYRAKSRLAVSSFHEGEEEGRPVWYWQCPEDWDKENENRRIT